MSTFCRWITPAFSVAWSSDNLADTCSTKFCDKKIIKFSFQSIKIHEILIARLCIAVGSLKNIKWRLCQTERTESHLYTFTDKKNENLSYWNIGNLVYNSVCCSSKIFLYNNVLIFPYIGNFRPTHLDFHLTLSCSILWKRIAVDSKSLAYFCNLRTCSLARKENDEYHFFNLHRQAYNVMHCLWSTV